MNHYRRICNCIMFLAKMAQRGFLFSHQAWALEGRELLTEQAADSEMTFKPFKAMTSSRRRGPE